MTHALRLPSRQRLSPADGQRCGFLAVPSRYCATTLHTPGAEAWLRLEYSYRELPIRLRIRCADLGRYEVTGDPADRWKFKTPMLRNVALTAPYMHDGSLPTLAAVIDYYDGGGRPHEGLDALLRPLGLTAEEKGALVRFLESLTGENVPAHVADALAAPVGDPH